jgi:hypothetical protein
MSLQLNQVRLIGHQETLIHGVAISLAHGFVTFVLILSTLDPISYFPGFVASILGSVVIFVSGLKNVPTGYHGVLKHFDKPQPGKLLDNGNHWVYPFPWVRSIELVPIYARKPTGLVEGTEVEFFLYTFMPIKAHINRLRWRITDPKVALEYFQDLSDEEVMRHVQDALIYLGQTNAPKIVDIVGNISGTFIDLRKLINESLKKVSDIEIPVEIVDLGIPRTTVNDPRFKDFVVTISLIDLWRRETNQSGEAFLSTYLMSSEGKITYKSHSTNVNLFLKELIDYYKNR